MSTQSIFWTALPNGFVNNDTLKVSVLVSPRLVTENGIDGKLDEFQTFIDWPNLVKNLTFNVEIQNGPNFTVSPLNSSLESSYWKSLFSSETYVRSYKFEDMLNRFIRSYPTKKVVTFVRQQYQDIAVQSPTQIPRHDHYCFNNAPRVEDMELGYPWPSPQGINFELSASDSDPNAFITFSIEEGPYHGTLIPDPNPRTSPNTMKYSFISSPFPGDEDYFTFKARNNHGAISNVATVTILFGGPDFSKLQTNKTLVDRKMTENKEKERASPCLAYVATNPEDEKFMDQIIDEELRKNHAISPEFQPNNSRLHLYQVRQFNRLLARKKENDNDPVPPVPTPPTLDFHQIIGSLSQYPELMRKMGIVIDLEISVNIPHDGNIRVFPANLEGVNTINYWTSYHLDVTNKLFITSSDAGSGISNGMLLLDPNEYEVITLDADRAALKLMDFASNLAMINPDDKDSLNTPTEYGVPSLTSIGFAIARAGRAINLVDRFQRASSLHNKMINNTNDPSLILKAQDVLRGYRIDVWDSLSREWHSLCWRNGRYHFLDSGIKLTLKDEGFISLTTSSPSFYEATDLHLPESLFRWSGWGLCIRRMGRTIGIDDCPIDTQNPSDNTNFKLEAFFEALLDNPAKHKLPRLRFGAHYQFRLRVVDVAGNSLSPESSIDSLYNIPSIPIPYLRYEPISAPVLVLKDALNPIEEPGESIENIVIRSNYYDEDADISERHIVPPKTYQQMAEIHGMFDKGERLDRNAYELITHKDGSFEHDDDGTSRPYPERQIKLPYLPDPLAAGATFQFYNLSGVSQGESFKIPFSGSWPNRIPFRIKLTEGNDRPEFEETNDERIFTIKLPKAEIVNVKVSCFLSSQDNLLKMAIWNWISELNPPDLEKLKKLSIDGMHWMISPYRTIRLVHAVRQPLISPEFQNLRAIREHKETRVLLSDIIPISGKSTQKLDINSKWKNIIYDDDEPLGYRLDDEPIRAHAFKLDVNYEDIVAKVGDYQEFPDTNYRRVTYTATAVSRFRDYFPLKDDNRNDTDNYESTFTRVSKPVVVDILNSARPPSPKVLFIIPTFEWNDLDQLRGENEEIKQEAALDESTNKTILHEEERFQRRRTTGLRVYLEGPWFLSGEGELLGVVLWGSSPPPVESLKSFELPRFVKPYVTQWGTDPIWSSNTLPTQAVPLLEHFTKAVDKKTQLSLEEFSGFNKDDRPDKDDLSVSVAGHKVEFIKFDEDRKLWYSDIKLDPGLSYFPFVRFAFARYQPHSISDAHLSRVVLADYIQLLPNRTASIIFDLADKRNLQVSVAGPSFNLNHSTNSNAYIARNRVQVIVEIQPKGTRNQDTWIPALSEPLILTPYQDVDYMTIWTAVITLPSSIESYNCRLRIEEYEVFLTGPEGRTQDRLIYADILKVWEN